MLNKLLSKERIQKVNQVADWKEAIAIAAKPLLEDGSIEESYIGAMIAAAEKYGPYMVLADHFAMPHAQGSSGVNKLSMSLLSVGKEVDLLGEPVTSFLVLASNDSTSHIDALVALSNLLMEEKNLEVFKTGDTDAIMALIQKEEEK